MKNNSLMMGVVAATMLLAACEKPPVAQAAGASDVLPVAKGEGKEYQIDTAASKITWIGTKVTGKHNGTINLKSGSVFVKEGNVVAGKFVADMASIDDKDLSGEYQAKLNKHLKSEDFFDVVKFPEGIFEISSVEKAANGVTIKGNLTLKGVTHGVTFDADIQSEKGVPKTAKANFNIDRKKWGIVYPGKPDDLISDTVNLTLDLKIKK
ncbi:MAG TPA: YceI family protein [Turneriella sp.]|nr:YceI family protein [Turneriella sp.]